MAGAGLLALTAPATAAIQTRSFDIKPQSANDAVQQFARQAGIQVIAPSAKLRRITTRAVRGNKDIDQAFHELLEGTRLRAVRGTSGTYLIKVASQESQRLRAESSNAGAATTTPSSPVESELATSDAEASLGSDIVVTARRVNERLDRVPISIAVVGEQALKTQQIQSLFMLQRTVPGLAIAGSNGASLASFIRGVTGVQQYFAAVPTDQSNPSNYFDIASVQVLKGPQGTLFGLGNTAGAVIGEPRAPERQFGGWVEAQIGSHRLTDLQAVLNIPVVKDKILLRVGGQIRKRDGYVLIIQRNVDMGEENRWLVRGSLTILPTEGVRNTTVINFYSQDEVGVGGFYLTAVNPTGLITAIYGNQRTFGGLTIPQLLALQKQLGPWKIYDINGDVPRSKRSFFTAINTTEIDISDRLTIKNIAAYRRDKSFNIPPSDVDLSPIPTVESSVRPSEPDPLWTATEEVQLLYKGEAVRGVVGSFNIWNGVKGDPDPVYQRVLGTLSASSVDNAGHSHGIYANGTLDIKAIPGLSVTGGLRRNWDYRTRINCLYTTAGVLTGCTPQKGDWRATSHVVGLQYQANERTLFYLTNSTGARSGGFNADGSPTGFETFGPESLNLFESGIKTSFDLGSAAVRLSTAAWYGKFSDIQVLTPVVGRDANGAPREVTLTTNAAKARIKGFEGEINVRLSRLNLTGSVNHNDNGYTDYMAGTQDLRDSSFIYSPKWQYHLAVDYLLPVPARIGEVSLFGNYTYTSRRTTAVVFPEVPENDVRANYVADAGLRWHDMFGSGIETRLTVTNVTNSKRSLSTLSFYQSFGFAAGASPRPREFNLTARYDF